MLLCSETPAIIMAMMLPVAEVLAFMHQANLSFSFTPPPSHIANARLFCLFRCFFMFRTFYTQPLNTVAEKGCWKCTHHKVRTLFEKYGKIVCRTKHWKCQKNEKKEVEVGNSCTLKSQRSGLQHETTFKL